MYRVACVSKLILFTHTFYLSVIVVDQVKRTDPLAILINDVGMVSYSSVRARVRGRGGDRG